MVGWCSITRGYHFCTATGLDSTVCHTLGSNPRWAYPYCQRRQMPLLYGMHKSPAGVSFHWDRPLINAAGFERFAVRPFKGPLLCSLPQFSGKHAERQLWGTYRPGLYLGRLLLRKIPVSVATLAVMMCNRSAISQLPLSLEQGSNQLPWAAAVSSSLCMGAVHMESCAQACECGIRRAWLLG